MRRYIFRLYVSPERDAILREQAKMMADLWNALKQRCEDVYRGHYRGIAYQGVIPEYSQDPKRRHLTFFDLTNEITGLRHECPEWRAIPAITAHRVAKQLTDAYAAFFRRLKAGEEPGYPAWHRRADATTVPLGTMDKTGWTLRSMPGKPFAWRLHYGSLTDVRRPDTWIRARGILPAAATRWRNADIIRRDDAWWLSVCVEAEPRRGHGRFPVNIRFDLIDDLAMVNGFAETPIDLRRAQLLQDDLDTLKSAHDLRWQRGRRRRPDEQEEFLASKADLSRRAGLIARVRRNALHIWSAGIVGRAGDLTIIAPPVKPHTRTPRGDKKNWGANIEVVSDLNRNTLSQAPAMAIAMLRYKAEEAGIRCDVVTDDSPDIAVGGDLVDAGKALRRSRRATRERKIA